MEDMQKQEVTIQTKISTSHMYDFLLRHTYTSFSGIFGVVLSLAALVLLLSGFAGGDKLKSILLLIGALLFTVIHPLQLLLKAKQQIVLTPMFKEPLSYTFHQDKIRIKQNAEHMDMKWEDIYKVIETKRSIIIYMNAVRAYILPKDQFPEAVEQVKDMLRSHTDAKICKLK